MDTIDKTIAWLIRKKEHKWPISGKKERMLLQALQTLKELKVLKENLRDYYKQLYTYKCSNFEAQTQTTKVTQ